VAIPARGLFTTAGDYYATLLHELAHRPGHKTRLDREGITDSAPSGSPVYSKEKLVAEMSSAYLCAEAEISTPVPIAVWLHQQRDDRVAPTGFAEPFSL
jgi:antirestriction protein ArdC